MRATTNLPSSPNHSLLSTVNLLRSGAAYGTFVPGLAIELFAQASDKIAGHPIQEAALPLLGAGVVLYAIGIPIRKELLARGQPQRGDEEKTADDITPF